MSNDTALNIDVREIPLPKHLKQVTSDINDVININRSKDINQYNSFKNNVGAKVNQI